MSTSAGKDVHVGYSMNFTPQQNTKFIYMPQCAETISKKLHPNKTVKYWQSMKIRPHILYTGKISPLFYFCPFHPHCHRANLRVSETVFSHISLLKQLCQGEFKTGKNHQQV